MTPHGRAVILPAMCPLLHRCAWLFGLASSACVIPNPNHCANLEGDATCIERGEGRHCTLCTRDNGCVADKPTAECTPDTPPVAGSSTTDAGGTTEGTDPSGSGTDNATSDGPAVDCDAEGTRDEDCPSEQPYCSGGTCVACDVAGGDDFCGGLDPAAPVCNDERVTCEPCTRDDLGSCPSDEVCGPRFTCVGCRLSSDCDSGACNPSSQSCVRGGVRWVDNGASNCPTDGTGTEISPFCTLGAAVADIAMSATGIIMLVGGGDDYDTELAITGGRTVAVVGVDNPNLAPPGTAVSVSTNSTALLSGLRIRESTTGVSCQSSTVALDDVAVISNGTGLMSTDCEVWVARSTVAGSDAGGIVADGGRVNLYAAMIVGNSGDGVDAASADLDMAFTTVAGNGGDALNCGDATMRSSIVVSSMADGSVNCSGLAVSDSALTKIPVTAKATDSVEVGSHDPSWFDNVNLLDYHLADPDSPFTDVGLWREGDPFEDIDGDSIPLSLGTRVFPGADQP